MTFDALTSLLLYKHLILNSSENRTVTSKKNLWTNTEMELIRTPIRTHIQKSFIPK